ncbi:centriolin-like [Diorhabda sublineata]|uniref:centriolin-like n=1 Tax=Diorhabda sublineata TaxID=1163346 RepID=UPI0024E0DAA8|nr:centriolin-like [Diorhabda sublineata]
MTQRFPRGSNYVQDGAVCEKYMARFLNREKQAAAAISSLTRGREKTNPHSQNQLIKNRPNVKQQNLPSPFKRRSPSQNAVQHSDDSALVELTVKAMNNHRQRSRSTTLDREPWGQLLKQHKSGDKISMFGNFDPLRTLHFLAKELQFQLQSVLPDDTTIQQMVADMQYALKRVPPEVASTVHLQQTIDIMPRKSNSRTSIQKPERLHISTVDCAVQTIPLKSLEDNDKLQQMMEEGTLKLENSCKHMEKFCTELKNEKHKLERELEEERHNNKILNKRILDLELENNEVLTPRVKSLEDEKRKLETQLKNIANKLENVSQHSFNDLKSQITELKSQKNALDQECNNLKHQMKVCALEREKFIAVLALRDAQINEIRSEMSQLQDVVNDQLMELQTNAFLVVPTIGNNNEATNLEKLELSEKNNQLGGDGTTSPTEEQGYYTPKQNLSFKDLQSGDIEISSNLTNDPEKPKYKASKGASLNNHMEKVDSQVNIRMMFNALKKTAYEVAGDLEVPNQNT